MTDMTPRAATDGGPAPDGMTDAEKLTALQTYLKALEPIEKSLRERVTRQLGELKVERVGAYLPDGEKLGAVGYNAGRKSAKVTDPAAALAWCIARYPDEIVRAINPAFLKKLTAYAGAVGAVGEPGVDPLTGEILPFIEVQQGGAFVTVTTTKEGVARMTQLAYGFAGMVETAAGREPGLHAPIDGQYEEELR